MALRDAPQVVNGIITLFDVKGGVKVDHVGGSTARLVAVENRTVLCLS